MIAQGVPGEEAKAASAKLGQEIFPAGSLVESLLLSSRIWKTWALVAVYFTTFGGFIALTAWLPVYWISFHSVTPVVAGALAGAYSILTSLVRVGWGGAAGGVGGLGALGGFAIPPVMGTVVQLRGATGYASGFVVFVGLAVVSLLLVGVLRRKRARDPGAM